MVVFKNNKENMLFQIIIWSIFCIQNNLVFCFSKFQISTNHQSMFDDQYEDGNSIGMITVNSLVKCTVHCSLNKRCVSFFFNTLTKTCILHRDPFIYTVISKSAAGWKFYITIDSKYTFSRAYNFIIKS